MQTPTFPEITEPGNLTRLVNPKTWSFTQTDDTTESLGRPTLKQHLDIRAQLEADGFMITVLRHGEIYTVAALKDGKTFIAQTEDLNTSLLETSWSIQEQKSFVG